MPAVKSYYYNVILSIYRHCSRMSQTTAHQVVQSETDIDCHSSVVDIKTISVPFHSSLANVGYADIGPINGPVCVALHGAPGSIQDTVDIAPALVSSGIRLIIPEFPGYGKTAVHDAQIFDESTDARTELIKSFLSAVGISRVAAMIGHSMGAATALNIAANTDICQAAVFLNGIGIEPNRTIRPHWLVKTAASIVTNRWIGPAASQLLTCGYNARGFDVRSGDTEVREGLKIALVSGAKIDFSQISNNVTRLRDKGLPLLFAWTLNDRLIESDIPMKTARLSGVKDEDMTWFDSSETVVKGSPLADNAVSYPRALVFERGGHFVHRSHQRIISSAIVDIVNFCTKP